MKLKKVLIYAILIGFVILCLVLFKTDIAQINFSSIWKAWDSILIATTLSFVNYFLRLTRWTFYLQRLKHKIKFSFSAITYIAGFAFTLSPGKVGEMIRGRYLLQKGIPISNTAAVFFIERLMDLLAIITLASLAVVSSDYKGLIWAAVATIFLILIILMIAPWLRIADWSEQNTWIPHTLKNILQKIFRTLIASKLLLNPVSLISGFLVGLIAWGCEGLGLMIISKIPGGPGLDIISAVSIYSVAVIVGALSFFPGGLGSTETVMVALLIKHNIIISDAILITMVCRLLTLWLAVFIGWLAVVALRPKKIKNSTPKLNNPQSMNTLCIDLDGTIILSDLLLESFLLLLKMNILYLFLIPIWLSKGKAVLKAEIAKRVTLNPATLPYNTLFLDWLRLQHKNGRQLWLCTASNHRLANLVANHLQIFSGVLSSTDTFNLSGRNKANLLIENFGLKNFDYCGNAKVDLAIWQVAQGAITVNCNEKVSLKASNLTLLQGNFPRQSQFLKSVFKSLRPHQWAKNMLIFIPLAAAHKIGQPLLTENTFLAFFAFGLCASSVYVLNDMFDLEADRQHPRKCKRPFASGKLSIITGLILVPVLLVASALIAVNLPLLFALTLLGYYCLTLAYTFLLKQFVLVDTICLAGLYTIRIIAGAAAIEVSTSFWLLLFSVFLFFSLALVKRYAELDDMLRQGKLKAAGRGYQIEDLPLLQNLGTASGNLCVLVLALYINSPAVIPLYRHPETIWFLCIFLLYWISRIWLKTHRGLMHDDPVVFALKDKISLMIGLLSIIIIGFAV